MELLTELSEEHFKVMHALERQYYAEDFITPYQEAYRWYQHYPYSTFAMADGNTLVGFINLFPIQPPVYEALKQGTFNDIDLKISDIIDLTQPSTQAEQMFLSCIVVDKDYRNQGITGMLLQAAAAYYQPYAERFDRIITDNVTLEGERFSKRLGFQVLGSSDHDSTIYVQAYRTFQQKVFALEREETENGN